jgi:hypothetical protein
MSELDLMIIGAQKAGTTSLLTYLRKHPQLNAHFGNEFSYFADEKSYKQGFQNAYNTYFTSKKGALKNVAKNVTICTNESAIQRLKHDFPNVKIVFILREPVSRTYSGYNMGVSQGWVHHSFQDIISAVLSNDSKSDLYSLFVSLGLYTEQIEILLKYFQSSQIRFILFEEFKTNPSITCNRICKWLEVDPMDNEDISQAHNVTTKSKSRQIASFINTLKKESNPIKQLLRQLLPYSIYSKIGSGLQSLNETEAKFDSMPDSDRKILKDHFGPFNSKLKSLLQQPQFEKSIEWVGRDNWLFNSKS